MYYKEHFPTDCSAIGWMYSTLDKKPRSNASPFFKICFKFILTKTICDFHPESVWFSEILENPYLRIIAEFTQSASETP